MPPDSARKRAGWSPVLVLIPAGIVIPLLTAAVAQSVARAAPAQPLADLLKIMAWNFMPFAVLMIVVVVALRYCSALTAWLTSLAGMIAAGILFAIMHAQAESALLAKHWTAAALASGFAALYAAAASAVVAIAVAVSMWLIHDRRRPRTQEPKS